MTVVAPDIPDLYAKLDAWLDENEPIKLHKPGGKGHNQKLHGARAKGGSYIPPDGGTPTSQQDGLIRDSEEWFRGKKFPDAAGQGDLFQWVTQQGGRDWESYKTGNGPKGRRFEETVRSAPQWKGNAYRQLTFQNESDRSSFMDGLRKGSVINSNRNESFSRDLSWTGKGSAQRANPSVVITVRNSKSMHMIEGAAKSFDRKNYGPQTEVVAIRGGSYRVQSISKPKTHIMRDAWADDGSTIRQSVIQVTVVEGG